MILHCCHLGRGSVRGLERVTNDPKGEDDRGEGERGRGGKINAHLYIKTVTRTQAVMIEARAEIRSSPTN